MIVKKDIRLLDRKELDLIVSQNGWKRFRADQLWQWLWKKNKREFAEMKNLPGDMIDYLSAHYDLVPLKVDRQQISNDGTIKNRIYLSDGNLIETVLIPVPNDKRQTVCVSSQVGCSLSCSFCATGKMKRIRNLEAHEIYDQVVLANNQAQTHYDQVLTNIVYMGMGEPLLNYKNVLKSIDLITSPEGLGMSPRRITVSTVGLEKMIRKLADDEVKFNLAISLHAANDEKRSSIMPINDQNNLASLMSALDYFYSLTKNRISYEYIALRDFNDGLEDAKELLSHCKRFPVKVNIIEYNTITGVDFEKANENKVDAFAEFLTKNGVMATVRRSRGKDIDAACGQLANKE